MRQTRPLWRIFPFYYGWAIVAAALVEHVVAVGLFNSQGVFLKPIINDFGWTRGMVAGAFALTSVVSGIAAPITGILVDRLGPRVLLVGAGALLALGYLLISQAGSLGQFYLFNAVFLGLGRSAATSGIIPIVPRWFEAKRGLTQGIVQAGGGMGTVLVPLVVTFLILSQGWRAGFVAAALVLAMTYGLVAPVFRRDPQEIGLLPDGRSTPGPTGSPQSARGQDSAPRFGLRQALRTVSLWQVCLIAVLASLGQLLIMTHLVAYATDKGISVVVAATFLSVIGVANMLGKLTMGTVSDRIGRRASMIMSYSLAAIMLLWLVVAQDAWAFFIFAAIFGFAYGSWMPMFPAIAADLFGVRSLGAIYGLVRAGMSLGGALGAYLGGYVFDATQSYNYAFFIAIASLAVGVVLLLTLHPPGQQRADVPVAAGQG